MFISRLVNISTLLQPGKTLLIFGPRRVGKTTLLAEFQKDSSLPSLPAAALTALDPALPTHPARRIIAYNGDNLSVQNNFSVTDITQLSRLVEGYDTLLIDEAQNIPQIGQSLKILNDQRPELTIIATGSSSFDLRGQVGEPLVGRQTTAYLYPLAIAEILASRPDLPPQVAWEQLQEQLLIYGLYPDSFLAPSHQHRQRFLLDLVDSLLLKDILKFQEVKGSDVLLKLLRLLAFQIGSEVSLEELGKNLGISKNTVARYLDLLEKSYVIFPLGGFSRNLRSEITKMSKYYFYDVGVRNALINNFNLLDMRDDLGKLWENFVLVERMKYNAYSGAHPNSYFWRTWSQNEIDLIEEAGGQLHAFECKFSSAKAVAPPKEFSENYPNSTFELINPANLLSFVTSSSVPPDYPSAS